MVADAVSMMMMPDDLVTVNPCVAASYCAA
jgi:hypothetical protein